MVPTNSSSADANGSHPRVSESPESELSSVPLTKTVLHPEPLFGYWHNSAISQPCRKEVPAWHPPHPTETSATKANIANRAQHLGNQPHCGRRSSGVWGRQACCGGSPALGSGLWATPRQSARRFGEPHAQHSGVTSAPRARRTSAKGALGSRPVASAEWGKDCGGSGDCWSGVRYTVGENVQSLGVRSGADRRRQGSL